MLIRDQMLQLDRFSHHEQIKSAGQYFIILFCPSDSM